MRAGGRAGRNITRQKDRVTQTNVWEDGLTDGRAGRPIGRQAERSFTFIRMTTYSILIGNIQQNCA